MLVWSVLPPVALGNSIASEVTSETVVINEIMYHPVEEPEFTADETPRLDLTEDVHEYVELYNYGSTPVALGHWKLAGGIHYTFPTDASLAAEAYLVVAKNPARLAAVPAYGLSASALFGPYTGVLSNQGDTVRLENASGKAVDSVKYSAGFPWPISADALGAGEEWTGLKPLDYQYRGRSLERVSPTALSNDPANWLASPLPGEPSPGRPNAVTRRQPLPVVIQLSVTQADDGQSGVHPSQQARLDVGFSAPNDLHAAGVDYFVDDINATGETLATTDLQPIGDLATARFMATLPGLPNRSVVRYRVRADRGSGSEVVSPRPDDPFRWHAYFVSAGRVSSNPSYELFISARSLATLATNISQNPKRVTLPDPPGYPRASWNATERGVFVCNGVVRDIRARHQGNEGGRGTNTYKLFFPRYNPFAGQHSLLLTEKPYDNVAAYGLFRAAGLPASLTRTVELYLNKTGPTPRLQLEDYNEQLLERYHQEQHLLNPSQPLERPGELYKATAANLGHEGPYGRGDGTLLPAIAPYWTPLQRYERTYPIQDHDWKGAKNLEAMIAGLWQARGDAGTKQNPDIPALRRFFQEQWDIDKTLTYLAVRNWLTPWDDSMKNYFLWQQADGKWTLLPWDMDSAFRDASSSIFAGEVGDHSYPWAGVNYFKDSFIKAFRQELIDRNVLLVNTLLHPDNIAALGYGISPGFAASRYESVMQQCGLSSFERPTRPVNQQPQEGSSAFPPAFLSASPYTHSSSPGPAHTATTWEIRTLAGSYSVPAFRTNTTQALTELAIPFDQLNFGETYLWRCTYWDANGHPSLSSAETSFGFGGVRTNVIPLIEIKAEDNWKYNEASAALPESWRQPDYDDSAWPTGAPLLAYPAAAVSDTVRTRLTLGHPTYYFRRAFSFATDLSQVRVRLVYMLVDGAVVYLNGAEVFRLRMPTGTIAYETLASKSGAWTGYQGPFDLPAPTLRTGSNVLAVEVHLTKANTTGVGFGLALSAVGVTSRPDDIVLNEIRAYPPATPDASASGSDWIELYNNSSLPRSLDGFRLTDDPLQPNQYLFPAGIIMPSWSFLLVWCDRATNFPGLHTGFALKKEGQIVMLQGPVTNGLALEDSIHFGLQIAGSAIGRVPDGGSTWQLTQPTPGAENVAQPTGSPEALRINEWMANPLTGDDWVELYNSLPQPIALGGLCLTDGSLLSDDHRIAPLSFIAGNAFVRFFTDEAPAKGAEHANFKLSAFGDSVSLLSSNGVLIDRVAFGAQTEGVSQGRWPDGTSTIVNFPGTSTPGQSNRRPLRLEAVWPGDNTIIFQFDSPANLGCEIQFCDILAPANWKVLQAVPPSSASERVAVTNTVPSDVRARFYRLRIPGS